MRSLVLACLAGCYIQPSTPPQAYPQQQPPPPGPNQPPPTSSVNRSVWQGTYNCAQGETALKLSVEQRCVGGGCEVSGVFDFGPTQTNPNLPHGSYRVRGEVSANERGEAQLVLRPEGWIEQPANYVMVGLSATTDPNQQVMRGRIDNPACGEMALGRTE